MAFALLVLFSLLNLWTFHRFRKPIFPLLLALLVSFAVYFLSPVLGLSVFLVGQTLAFYAAGKR